MPSPPIRPINPVPQGSGSRRSSTQTTTIHPRRSTPPSTTPGSGNFPRRGIGDIGRTTAVSAGRLNLYGQQVPPHLVPRGHPSSTGGTPVASAPPANPPRLSYAQAAASGAARAPVPIAPRPVPVAPAPAPSPVRGFANRRDFANFGRDLHNGLARAGYPNTQGIMQGSAVTGRSYRTGAPFDHNRTSDFDVAIAGPDIHAAARQAGIETRSGGRRTGPLYRHELNRLGLNGIRRELSHAAGRPVKFMVYGSPHVAINRSPSVMIPR